jgi:L-arabinose transport system substrate-binding protein
MAITNMTTTLTAYPQVTHWMFWSCNDDGVLGGVRAMENSGMGADQAIGVGIDGSRSCGLFGQGQKSGFRGTMWLNSALHGQLAIQLLHDAVANGKPLPQKTYSDPILINEETFPQYKEMLGC